MVEQVCRGCGAFADGRVSADGPGWAIATCPHCGHRSRFRHLPLFVLTGASGTGKTTACQRLYHTLPECVVLESDVLLAALASFADEDVRQYWNLWLRLIIELNQAGKPVLVCGTVVPRSLESSPNRSGLTDIHYLALICDDAALQQRLRDRPAWRGCDHAFIAKQIEFNRRWRDQAFREDEASEKMAVVALLDTTTGSPERTVEAVRAWVRQGLGR